MPYTNCTLYVVRHGQSEHNRDYVVSGHVNPPLTELGIAQAKHTRDRLQSVNFDDAYSSDLERAINTASIIYGKPIDISHQLKGLRERNFGILDGKSETLLDRLADSSREYFKSLSTEQQWTFKYAPDIESDHELSLRFIATLERIANSNLGKTILVAAHGGAIRTMIIKLMGLNTTDMPRGSIENSGYVHLSYDGHFKVEKIVGLKQSKI